jgi:DNA polymerase V
MSHPDRTGTLVPVLRVTQLSITLPLYHSVRAGFPSPADDHEEEHLDLNRYLIKNPSATFFLRVEGHSMTGAGIYPDDILIVDRSLEARPNDVIVAVLEGEFTLKRLVKEGREWLLRAEHPDYPPTPLDGYLDFLVWGVVTHVIHRPYPL